jgi:hypothetical protein
VREARHVEAVSNGQLYLRVPEVKEGREWLERKKLVPRKPGRAKHSSATRKLDGRDQERGRE